MLLTGLAERVNHPSTRCWAPSLHGGRLDDLHQPNARNQTERSAVRHHRHHLVVVVVAVGRIAVGAVVVALASAFEGEAAASFVVVVVEEPFAFVASEAAAVVVVAVADQEFQVVQDGARVSEAETGLEFQVSSVFEESLVDPLPGWLRLRHSAASSAAVAAVVVAVVVVLAEVDQQHAEDSFLHTVADELGFPEPDRPGCLAA